MSTKQVEETIWQGIVQIDESFDAFATTTDELFNFKKIIISDITFSHKGIGNTSTDLGPLSSTTEPISIIITDKEITPLMECTVIKNKNLEGYEAGLFKKTTKYHLKSFEYEIRLRPVQQTAAKISRLYSFRTKLGKDNHLNIHKRGIVSLFTGSRNESSDATKKSLTILFVASKENPFSATLKEKGITSNVLADDEGFKEKPNTMLGDPKSSSKQNTSNLLSILKTRLEKGEITLKEYEQIRHIIE